MDLPGKLQLKPGHTVSIVNAPTDAVVDLGDDYPTTGDPGSADAVIVFCANRAELDRFRDPVVPAAARDALTWVAYPKAGKLDTDLNRDSLAAIVKKEGVRPVRQVAVDEVWSALRLRPA
jgi:hypothetical protein